MLAACTSAPIPSARWVIDWTDCIQFGNHRGRYRVAEKKQVNHSIKVRCYLEGAEYAPAGALTVDGVSTGMIVELAKSTPKSVHVPQHLKARQNAVKYQ